MNKIVSLVTGFLLLFWSAAGAQTIHGDPQKAAYADPSEYPTISGQCHWTSPTANMPGMPAHTHVDLKFPLYSEQSQPFTVPVTITMFHTAGQITASDFEIGLSPSGFVPDTPFPWVGDVNGIKVFTGHVTYDPALSSIKKGWQPYGIRGVYTHYANSKEVLINKVVAPVYNLTDPTAVEAKPGDGTGIRQFANCEVRDYGAPANGDTGIWQSNVIEFLQMLPVLGPISPDQPWKLWMNGYNYGSTSGLVPGTLRVRVDPDLHNNIPGTVIFEQLGKDTTIQPYAFPNLVPDGTHKMMFQWDRPDAQGTHSLVSNLVMSFTVGAAGTGAAQPPNTSQVITSPTAPVTTPTTCQDPAATNVGGPLPCVYPPPPEDRCTGLVGQSGMVVINGIPFQVTITSTTCGASVSVQ